MTVKIRFIINGRLQQDATIQHYTKYIGLSLSQLIALYVSL
jgi:hypothetical protein